MEFSHPYFQRDHPYLLEHIKRKISTAKTTNVDDKANVKHEIVSKVLSDVKLMKGRQDSLDNRFVSMKQENEALWREVAILRQKHMKQQQIVNKLIQFLVTIVQPQRGSGIGSMGGMGGVKRRFQLMINDIPDAAKKRKASRSSTDGPIIRELTEELFDSYATDIGDDDCNVNSPYVVSPGSFPVQTPTYEIENIDEIDADEQIITDDDAAAAAAASASSSGNDEDNSSGSVYNTADYNGDLIYDLSATKTPSVGLMSNNASDLTAAENVASLQVDELLENVANAVQDPLSSFIKVEPKSRQQPILVQAPAQGVKSTFNAKLLANKTKQLPGMFDEHDFFFWLDHYQFLFFSSSANVILTKASASNVQGMKRLPIMKIAQSQVPANSQMTSNIDRRINASGKSLLDAQKLKAVRQQQQQQQTRYIVFFLYA